MIKRKNDGVVWFDHAPPARPPQSRGLRLQRVIGDALWYTGLTALARHAQRGRSTARILGYHHVLPADDLSRRAPVPWPLYTEVTSFAWQMRYIARHYHPVALPDLVDRLTGNGRVRPGSVAVTLDDGYRDQLAHALPVLRAAGIPATLCVVGEADPSGAVREGGCGWDEGEGLANVEDLRAARGDGITLAAHTATHRDLTACAPADARAELAGSRRYVRALGDVGDLLCYPGGMHDAAVRAAAAATGYRAALTCAPGANGAGADPLALRRVLVGASPDHVVAAQLAGLLDGPAWAYHGLNRLRARRAVSRRRVAAASTEPSCHCAVAPPPIEPSLPDDVWPRVTVAVPTYNERDTIDRCLQGIATQEYPRDRLEILVVDGGSTDDTVARAARYPGVRVLHNPARDAETAKEIGLGAATGALFMYLDADAEFARPGWLRAMIRPFREDPTLVASFTRFVARPGAPALDRYLNQHPLQLGPLLRALCVDIAETRHAERAGYSICCFAGDRVPPVGLCLYRIDALRALVAGARGFRWIDVAVPALLARAGHAHVAYVPEAGIHHGRRATLRTLIARQQRDLTRTYLPHVDRRAFRYVDFSSPRSVLPLLGWVVRVNLLLPPLVSSVRESWRRRDPAALYGFPLAVLETDAVALAFVRHPTGRALLWRGLRALLRARVDAARDQGGRRSGARVRVACDNGAPSDTHAARSSARSARDGATWGRPQS